MNIYVEIIVLDLNKISFDSVVDFSSKEGPWTANRTPIQSTWNEI